MPFTTMLIKGSVSELMDLFNHVKKEPSKMFELIRTDAKEMVGKFHIHKF